MSEDRNILNFIRSICASGESGRLEILAGSIQGELSFADGKLVDARVGHLTGFRAVNAVAAMRDARFSFDPAFAPLGSSSINASERVVLKQFFGIETVAAREYIEPAPVSVPVSPADEMDEVTVVRNDVSRPEVPIPPRQVQRFPHRTALAFAVLAIAVLAAAAVLIYRFRDPGSETVVASVESPSTPLHSVSAPSTVKEDKKSPSNIRDLSGKWNVVNSVDTTSYGSFRNMKIGFALSINQSGTSFTGTGHKVSENGRTLPAGSRTPIQVKGSINGDRIDATFVEEGTARKSNGKFVWRLDRNGRGLTGSFATSAARSSGKSAAIRL